MPPLVMALIFGGLALLAGWSIRHDFVTGVASDDLYRFGSDDNPLGFAAIVAGKVFIIGFGAAEVLFACGLIGDPVLALRSALPFLMTD